ncbi:hypothetical protein [Microseira wollei]|uniref:hypothetical protein n=1 Tax=Microseira wollei TaxID=467598 RepID=UPI001CFC8B83|nr:hypothetical protein [Microseira wollei]
MKKPGFLCEKGESQREGDGVAGNQGFGAGELLAKLNGTTGFTADNISLNLAANNTAQFLFA